jgi:fructose-bisphosphate aldolase class I
MNVRFKSRMPWELGFSFARAIQQPALEIWHGEEIHVPAAQKALYHRAVCNRAARLGTYDTAMELQDREIVLSGASSAKSARAVQ